MYFASGAKFDKALIPFQGRLGFKRMHPQNGQVCNVVVIFFSQVNLEGTRTYELSCALET